jgi:hypothetical protein
MRGAGDGKELRKPLNDREDDDVDHIWGCSHRMR